MFALIVHACVGRSGSIEGLLVTVLCPRARPAAYYWIHPGRPIPTRLKDCWLWRKESSHASQNKQTNKPNAPTLPCQAQLLLIHVKSLQICWATPT